MRLGLVSLGCDKNTVDSERMLGELVGHGARPVEDLRDAEVILINTCGFIDAAKEESIETLFSAARLKQDGTCKTVVAVGCLVERYREDLAEALPEVDLFLGLRDIERLVPELRTRGLLTGTPAEHPGDRTPLGSRHVSYLKVSEGCDHGCAFCAIPLWRGRHRSFGIEQLVAEAQRLEIQGAVELNLVAQDLAHFGRDRRDGSDITALVRALLSDTSIPWFRLLYIYSAGLREPLVELMATEPRLLPYIDMPIQHASDPVLERMRRPERDATLRAKIAWLRDSVPDLTLRTTVMVGFPGESEEDFRHLLDFLDEVRFDRLGAFAFSPQDGTRATELEDLYVDEDVAQERLAELLEIQRSISAERLAANVGRRERAIVDSPQGPAPDSDGGYRALGRLVSQADDVDGSTDLSSASPLSIGALVEARIVDSDDFDLRADVLRVVREPSRPSAHPASRSLPVMPLGLDTAWGR